MNLVYNSLLIVTISAFYCRIASAEIDSAHAIQIISSANNHTFSVKLKELSQILEVDDIKDRNVVVVSIAGAPRKGKSFILNFFLKYLYAQVNDFIKFHVFFIKYLPFIILFNKFKFIVQNA